MATPGAVVAGRGPAAGEVFFCTKHESGSGACQEIPRGISEIVFSSGLGVGFYPEGVVFQSPGSAPEGCATLGYRPHTGRVVRPPGCARSAIDPGLWNTTPPG